MTTDVMKSPGGVAEHPDNVPNRGCGRLCRVVSWTVCILFVLVVTAFFVTGRVMRSPYWIYVPPLELERDDSIVSVDNNSEAPIVIIGAGTAGLFAAYTMEYLGFSNYVLLEASDMIGGRVRETTDFLDEIPLDLGAEWIHGHPEVLSDLLLFEEDKDKASSIETIEFQPQTYRALVGGNNRRFDFFRFFYKEYKFKNTTWFSYLSSIVFSRVQDRVVLNSPVTSVVYGEGGASSEASSTQVVTTESGISYNASAVIVATPLAVVDLIQFQPPLPQSRQQAVNRTYIPSGLKVWFKFRERFYPDMQDAGQGLFSSSFFVNAVFGKDTDDNVLLYFSVGEETSKLTDLTDEEIVSSLLELLDDIFDGQASQYLEKSLVQNWAKESYIGGAYVTDWEFDSDLEALAVPVANELFFAGASTYANELSTVHGAAISGRRAAEAALHSLLR